MGRVTELSTNNGEGNLTMPDFALPEHICDHIYT